MTEAERERVQEAITALEGADSDLMFLPELQDEAGEDRTDDVREVECGVGDALDILRELLKEPASDGGEDEGDEADEVPED